MWKIINSKKLQIEEDEYTDYTWYNSGDHHIFMIGSLDWTDPDPEFADYETWDYTDAKLWYENTNTLMEDNR